MRFLILLLIPYLALLSVLDQSVFGQGIAIQLPDTVVVGGTSLIVPITVDDLTGHDIISIEFTLSYDSTVIRIDDIIKDNYLANALALFEFNATKPGQVKVAGASGSEPLAGEGILLALQVSFLKEGSSPLTFEEFKLDPGDPSTNLIHGRVRNISLANRDQHESRPLGLTLQGHFPNPISERTRVILDLHEPAIVRIDVYNSLGRSVFRILDRHMPSGFNQHIDLNLRTAPSGVYIYRVSAKSQSGYHTATNFFTVIH